MQFKALFAFFSTLYVFSLLAFAAPVEKKALRQYEMKRDGPTPVARAEAGQPSGYKCAAAAAPSGY